MITSKIKMKLMTGFAAIALLAAAPADLQLPGFVSAAQAQDARVSFNLFYDDLDDHGVWVRHAKYRYVWCPRVDANWRPYTKGHWIYLRDRGWYFQSREPFAWAVYHYGRWVDDRRLGWCWVPGTRWAPAWVSWRRSNDYVGWAPLPPEGDGFSLNIDVNVGEPPEDDWVFIPTRRFVEPDISINIVFGDRDRDVFRRTEYVGPVVVQNNTVVNNVIDIDFIQQQTNTTVEVVEPQETADPQAAATADAGAAVVVPTQDVAEPAQDVAPPAAVDEEQAAQELQRPADGTEGAAPAEGTDQPAAGTETEAGTDAAAPAEGSTDANASGNTEGASSAEGTDAAAPAAGSDQQQTCPEGQQLVDGACVAANADANASATEPDVNSGDAATDSNAATDEGAAAADQSSDDAASDAAAPADNDAAAPADTSSDDAATEAAPTDETPAGGSDGEDDPSPNTDCPEGTQLVDGQCVPAAGDSSSTSDEGADTSGAGSEESDASSDNGTATEGDSEESGAAQ